VLAIYGANVPSPLGRSTPCMVNLMVTMHGGSRTGGHIEGTPIITTLISDGTPAGATQGRSFK
jgi:hypothetical protein